MWAIFLLLFNNILVSCTQWKDDYVLGSTWKNVMSNFLVNLSFCQGQNPSVRIVTLQRFKHGAAQIQRKNLVWTLRNIHTQAIYRCFKFLSVNFKHQINLHTGQLWTGWVGLISGNLSLHRLFWNSFRTHHGSYPIFSMCTRASFPRSREAHPQDHHSPPSCAKVRAR